MINTWFLVPFLGTAAACVFLAVSSLSTWQKSGAAYVLIGSLLYLVGIILVTVVFNVPRNDALAAAVPGSVAGASVWAGYVASWTAWNHVRTAATLAAAAALIS